MIALIKDNIEKISEICRNRQVKTLYLFGSAARAIDFSENSDIDFLVEFNYRESINDNDVFEHVENSDTLKEDLINIVRRDVDLIEEKNIKNKFLRYFINKEKKLIYGLS